MKIYIYLLVAIMLTFSMCSCSKFSSASENSQFSLEKQKSEEIADPFIWNTPTEIYVYTGLVPEFLTQYQQNLFIAANSAYNYINISEGFNPGSDTYTDENGVIYYIDNGFESYDDFLNYWKSYFTDEFIKNNILNNNSDPLKYIDYNGKLYSLLGSSGFNPDYQYSSFEPVSGNSEEVIFNIIGHYDDTETMGDKAVGATTKSFRIVLKNTSAGWKFDEFYTPY